MSSFFFCGVHGNLLDSPVGHFFATPQLASRTGRLMTWGDGVPATDWALAAEKAGAMDYRVLTWRIIPVRIRG